MPLIPKDMNKPATNRSKNFEAISKHNCNNALYLGFSDGFVNFFSYFLLSILQSEKFAFRFVLIMQNQ